MDILITGASTGIGKAAGIHMARLGHTVWAGVRTEKAFNDIKRLNVQHLEPIFIDVTSEDSIQNCVSHIRKNSGILHALVNNAGIAVGGPVEGVRMEEWRHQFDVNFFGQIRLTQVCLPLLRETKGRIVMMSSIAGRVASPFLGPYAASKFALEAASDSLRRELRRFGVSVSVIEPGPIATPIWEKSLGSGAARLRQFSDEVKKDYGPLMAKFNQRIDLAARNASPVSVVVNAIEHALTSKHPRTRYPVGKGVSFSTAIAGVLPDRWLDRIFR